MLSWQGDGAQAVELEEVAPGRFVAAEPVPAVGRWKSIVRLHVGDALLAAPVYLPEDVEIDAPLVPAVDRRVELGGEQDLLLREVKDGPATTAVFAYTVIAAVVVAWVLSFRLAVNRIAGLHSDVNVYTGSDATPSRPERAGAPAGG